MSAMGGCCVSAYRYMYESIYTCTHTSTCIHVRTIAHKNISLEGSYTHMHTQIHNVQCILVTAFDNEV